MARNVFFSFHYDNDVSRAFVVRNSYVTKADRIVHGIVDKADFETIKRQGELAVKRWIDLQLQYTSVTVVLIGSETLNRPFVKYEIEKSISRNNAIIGVFVDRIKDLNGYVSLRCDTSNFRFPLYDYVWQDGYNNLGSWVEDAARAIGK
jgi:hypothetical protein